MIHGHQKVAVPSEGCRLQNRCCECGKGDAAESKVGFSLECHIFHRLTSRLPSPEPLLCVLYRPCVRRPPRLLPPGESGGFCAALSAASSSPCDSCIIGCTPLRMAVCICHAAGSKAGCEAQTSMRNRPKFVMQQSSFGHVTACDAPALWPGSSCDRACPRCRCLPARHNRKAVAIWSPAMCA